MLSHCSLVSHFISFCSLLYKKKYFDGLVCVLILWTFFVRFYLEKLTNIPTVPHSEIAPQLVECVCVCVLLLVQVAISHTLLLVYAGCNMCTVHSSVCWRAYFMDQ